MPRLDQKAENVESGLVREPGQGGEGVILFHISINIEVTFDCQPETDCLDRKWYSSGNRQRLVRGGAMRCCDFVPVDLRHGPADKMGGRCRNDPSHLGDVDKVPLFI